MQNKILLLADPDSMSTGSTSRPPNGIGKGFERAGRLAGAFTPISTASVSMCCNGALYERKIK